MNTDTTWLENEGYVQYLTPDVDRVCDRFESAWKATLAGAGRRPQVEDYLPPPPDPERKVLLRELMELDFSYRKKHEERAGRAAGSNFPTPLPWETIRARAPGGGEEPQVPGTSPPAPPLLEEGRGEGMVQPTQIRCLHCHQPIELAAENRPDEVSCPSCGGSFRVCDIGETRPRTLGKFRLLERVGIGAYGEVWKALDTELHRVVALKIPHAVLSNYPRELERFHREARAAAQLRHPGIVTVHEVMMLEGLPIIVSDFIDGVTLRELSKERRLTFRDSATLLAQVADALDYAHSMGLVHRDIKPANIMVRTGGVVSGGVVSGKEDTTTDRSLPSPDDSPPAIHESPLTTHHSPLTTHQPMIMDFGLALRDEAEITMTVDGHIVGTPAYMSPEQASGKGHQADRRSDVYSLGVILYELLSGELPFRGSKKFILEQVQSQEPRAPRQINDKIPRDLQTICLKAMAKSPPRRYATARELGDDLRRFQKGEPILARPVSGAEKFARWCGRNPGWALTGTFAAACLAGVIALLALFGIHESEAAATLAQEQTKTKTAAATLAFDRGWNLCQQGQVSQGLLWLARALETAPDDATRLQHVIRVNLADWAHQIPFPKLTLPHGGAVHAAAFSPDGKTVLTASFDGALRLWDAGTGQPVKLAFQPEAVLALAFSPDGKLVVTGSEDKTARVWNLATGEPVSSPLVHRSGVYAVAFSPDGKRVITSCADKTAHVWTIATGKRITLPLAGVLAVAFSRNGKTVATAGEDKTARLWEADTGKALGGPLLHSEIVHAVSFSPDGKNLLTGCDDKKARLWDINTGQVQTALSLHRGPVRAVAFSRDGKTILTGSIDHTARLWDTMTSNSIGAPFQHQDAVAAVAFSSDGRKILTASSDANVRLWDMAPAIPSNRILPHKGRVRGVAFSPDGNTAITASYDNTARLWDTGTDKPIGVPLTHDNWVLAVAFSPDGKMVATGSRDKTACLWDAKTGKQLHRLLGHQDWVWAVDFSPDGKSVLTASSDGTARTWEVTTGKEIPPINAHQEQMLAAAFSPDGKTIVTGSFDTSACLWEADSGKLIHRLAGHQGPINLAAFSPDGKTVLTASADGTARLWETATGNLSAPPLPHLNNVWAATFSPTGKTVVTGSYDNTAQLWDAATGQPMGPPLQHKDNVLAVAFSPNGQTILTGSSDATAQLWDAATGHPLGLPFQHQGKVWAVAFSPDGKTILTGSDDFSARLWRMPTHMEGTPASIVLAIQGLTGMELDAGDEVRELKPEERQRRLAPPSLP